MTQVDNIAECFIALVNKARKGDEQSRKELLIIIPEDVVEKLISINLKENE